MSFELTFLGTGDSMGVPRVYCDCAVCTEARTTGRNRRFRSSALLTSPSGERLLLDCGPDWLDQMRLNGLRSLETALITHAHHDHIAGLPEWADACRWTRTKAKVYAPSDVHATIRGQYPWLERHMQLIPNEDGCAWAGWSIRPTPVCHGRNGLSYAYVFERAEYRWAYCPDAIALTERQKEPLKRLDLLVLGTNFYKEEADPSTRSVYDMVEALQLLEELDPSRVVFTHLSHGVDREAVYDLPDRVRIADHGLRLVLTRTP